MEAGLVKRTEEILLDLIAIPSVSPMSNQPVIDYAMSLLDPRLWRFHHDSYRDAAGTPKSNLIALTKNAVNPRAELAFVCHTDTVPFEAGWAEAVHPVLRCGRVYGRGSCDVKGYLACVLAALSDLDMSSLCQPLALILTADEEVGCLGAKRLAAQGAISVRHMLIGEPTGLQPVRAGKGYALAAITVRGREAHSAFPSKGHSAIYDAARVVSALERVAKELERYEDPAFDPPFTTLNIGLIHGGTAKNIVPGECRLVVEWRPVSGQDPNMAADLIRGELAALRASFEGFDAEFEPQRMDPPFSPSPASDLSTFLAENTAMPPGAISFGSEAAHLSRLAEEVVVFGPGDMGVAHKTGEFVPVAELDQCVACLKRVITRFCGFA
jgi:acetylornithine deacetylase